MYFMLVQVLSQYSVFSTIIYLCTSSQFAWVCDFPCPYTYSINEEFGSSSVCFGAFFFFFKRIAYDR